MLRIKNFAIILIILGVLLAIYNFQEHLLPEPEVFVNGEKIYFDTPLIYQDSDLLVPLRGILSALDVELFWDEEKQSINVEKDSLKLAMQIDSKLALLNDEEVTLKYPLRLVEGRVFVPLEFIAQALGAALSKKEDTRQYFLNTGMQKKDELLIAKTINNSGLDFSLRGISLGDSEDILMFRWGEPTRKDLSEYGFYWYIYNQNYDYYAQIGVEQGRVVAIYSNTANWSSPYGINIGNHQSSLRDIFGEPKTYIVKQGTKYIYEHEGENIDRFLVDGYYLLAFYDAFNEKRLTSLMLIDEKVEKNLNGFLGEINEEVLRAYERQLFDLSNAIRKRMGKPLLRWDEVAASAAKKHSADMASRGYFAHETPEGLDPFYRLEQEGLLYRAGAENIAAGVNAIFSHESLMNSYGHRKNILMEVQRLGVGSVQGDEESPYAVYHTQKFYTPR